MENIHPHRKKALLYLGAALSIVATCVVAGLVSTNYDQKSKIGNVLGFLIVITAIYAFIFTVPFLIYAFKYWRAKSEPSQQQPEITDNQTHSISVQYTTSVFAKLTGLLISKVGTLEWNIATKSITLKKEGGNGDVVFETRFENIKKFESNINMITVYVRGIGYTCAPFNPTMNAATGSGVILGDQLPAIVLGGVQFHDAGMPELAAALKQQNVRVLYTSVTGAVEKGFDVGFVVAIVLLIFVLYTVSSYA